MTNKAIFAAVLAVAVLPAVAGDSGWDNARGRRPLKEPVKQYWEAPLARGEAAFTVEKFAGAEGEVTFDGCSITVRKTNGRGWIMIRSKERFSVKTGTVLRSFADSEVHGADPFNSVAVLRLFGKRETLSANWELDVKGVFMLGGPKTGFLSNTAPGAVERRFACLRVTEGTGNDFAPVLIVAGAPSVSIWRRWGVEDRSRAENRWKTEISRSQGVKGRFSEGIPAAEYLKRLESDFEHQARVVKGAEETRLVVDGKVEAPVFYKPNHGWPDKWYRTTGSFLEKEGLRLQVVVAAVRACWERNQGGFDAGVEKALAGVLDQMRRSPDALFLVTFSLTVPREYTELHPEETWRNPDGTAVYGNKEKIRNWQNGKPPAKCWPWPSLHSPQWQGDIKRFISRVIEGMKANGLSKRVIGFHFCGYHDGQFAPYRPDYSIHAHRAFRRWLAERGVNAPEGVMMPECTRDDIFFNDSENGLLKKETQIFQHVAPFRIQEDLARHAKAAFAKDVIALHWSMDVLETTMSGSFYLGEFMKSDAMDGLVTQPSYVQRPPSLALGEQFPAASFVRNGKLYVDEFDLRSYGLVAGYVNEVSARALGHACDFAEWQTIHHRIAGIGMARRQGWWYYEISGGFFEPPEIAADIGDVVRIRGEAARADKSSWRPSVAFVIDEKGLLERNYMCGGVGGDRSITREQSFLMAASGVPYDVWLADDVFADGSILDGRRTVVIAGFCDLTGKRAALVRKLLADGASVVLLAGSGAAGGSDAFGYGTVIRPELRSHELESLTGRDADFRSVYHSKWMRWTLGVSKGDFAAIWRPSCYALKPSGDFETLARYVDDSSAAAISRKYGKGRLVVLGEQAGLSPSFFNRLARESGAYVPVSEALKLQVDMNGDFVSVHALDTGRYDFRLPFPCEVVNIKSGVKAQVGPDGLVLDMTAGETRWYSLRKSGNGSR